jgi:hypothetical protein
MTMTNADQAYDDLIEISARSMAFSDLTGRALPRRVQELISEAADLRGAWDKYSGEGAPGSADLPIVDAVIDEAYVRANSLRCEIMGEVRYAGTTDVSGLTAQVRELVGRLYNRHEDAAGADDPAGGIASPEARERFVHDVPQGAVAEHDVLHSVDNVAQIIDNHFQSINNSIGRAGARAPAASPETDAPERGRTGAMSGLGGTDAAALVASAPAADIAALEHRPGPAHQAAKPSDVPLPPGPGRVRSKESFASSVSLTPIIAYSG